MASRESTGSRASSPPASALSQPRERALPVDTDGVPAVQRRAGQQPIRLFEDRPKEILSRNDYGPQGVHYTLNPYRGCTMGCVYCAARPLHEYLGDGKKAFNAGPDFDSRILERPDAPQALHEALSRKKMAGRVIHVSGATDPYQPLESALRITRACLEVCLQHGNPVALQTKSELVLRDRDLLAALARGPGVHVAISLSSLDPARALALEPGAPSPSTRVDIIRQLAEARVPVGISVAPAILGLTDTDIVRMLTAAKDAGASTAFYLRLRLPGLIEPALVRSVQASLPDRARKVVAGLGGFGAAPVGRRAHADDPMEQIFCFTAERLGLAFERHAPWPATVAHLGEQEPSAEPAEGQGATRMCAARSAQLSLF